MSPLKVKGTLWGLRYNFVSYNKELAAEFLKTHCFISMQGVAKQLRSWVVKVQMSRPFLPGLLLP